MKAKVWPQNLFWHISMGDRKWSKILDERKILGSYTSLNGEAKILWQFEDLQNYKDLYGKPLEHEWKAKLIFLIKIPLISYEYM